MQPPLLPLSDPTEHPASKKGGRRYWWRLVRLFAILLVSIILAMPIIGGIASAIQLTYAGCRPGDTMLAAYGDYNPEEFMLEARSGGRFKGYFIPGSNGATIVYPPAFSSRWDRRLADIAPLLKHGYSVVVYNSRPCSEDMKPLSLGYQEVDEVGDVLHYLRQRGDVDMNRIGIHGFSAGGATAIMAAARYPEIRAVIAMGGYADMDDIISDYDGKARFFVSLYRWSLRQTYRIIVGESFDKLSPLDVIDQIAPRPILLIYGSSESSLAGAYRQLARAGDNAELWVVPAASHGNYAQIAYDEYETRTVAFLDRALLESETP